MTLWTWIRTVYEWGGPVTWALVAICFGMSIGIGAETHTWWGGEHVVDGNFVGALAIAVVLALLALAWSCARSASLTKDLRRAVNSRHNLGVCDSCNRRWIHHTDWELELCLARELDRVDVLNAELHRSDLSVLVGRGADAGVL